MKSKKNYDVIIIGGSYAGLSAAMALGRSLRDVLIIDSGLPCNRQTPHSHNFITHDGEAPAAIAEKAKARVLKYKTVDFHPDLAIGAIKTDNGFQIDTAAGLQFTAGKLIFATGLRDTMPAIKGFADCWGISVIHCPYCHGYEYREKRTGVMANGDKAFHIVSLVRNLTDDLTILTSGKAEFQSEHLSRLNRHGIEIVENEICEIEHQSGHVTQAVFKSRPSMIFEAIYAALPFVQSTDIPVSLGCELTEQGHLKVDRFQETTVSGVFACGDNAGMMRSIASAVATGNIAGAAVNNQICEAQFL